MWRLCACWITYRLLQTSFWLWFHEGLQSGQGELERHRVKEPLVQPCTQCLSGLACSQLSMPSPWIAALMDGIWVPSKFFLARGFALRAWNSLSRGCAFRRLRTAGKGLQMFRVYQDPQWKWCWTRQLTSTEEEGPSLSF